MKQQNKDFARKKAKDVVKQLKKMKLKEAAKKVEDGIEETLTYMDFPSWQDRETVMIPFCRSI